MSLPEWVLRPSERGICVGTTGAGKSTLCTQMMYHWRQEVRGPIFIIDSKPRYRAQYTPNGMEIVYKDWVKGDYFPNSIAVWSHMNLKQLYQLTDVVILQSCYPDKTFVENFQDIANKYAADLFRLSAPKRPTLLDIDEFYEVVRGIQAITDPRVLKAIRAGREVNMAVLAGAQRPVSIPRAILTEASKYYIFELEFEEDIKYMRKYGPRITTSPHGYSFVFYNRLPGGVRQQRLMEIALPR